jgi:hypothetical protein
VNISNPDPGGTVWALAANLLAAMLVAAATDSFEVWRILLIFVALAVAQLKFKTR